MTSPATFNGGTQISTGGSGTLAFSSQRFREEREADWLHFEALLNRLEKNSARALDDEELLQLPVLYRATLSSLSIARATSLDKAMLDYLEDLALRGYFLIYGVRESGRSRIAQFFTEGWPRAVRSIGRELIIASLVLLLGAVAGYLLVMAEPQWFHSFVSEEMASGRTPKASAAELRETLGGEESGLEVFATMLFTHNSQVAITAFALGFAFGLPTLILLLYNGLTLGAMVAVFVSKGVGIDFAAWLSIHGTTELFAIALAGAAGLKIGTAVAFPGAEDRLVAASRAGRESAKVMIGVVLMLLMAGLLEGFGRQLITSTPLRFTVGGIMLILWLFYFYAPRRKGTSS